jgi:acetate---CoA ligase (ADP-forming)
VAPLPAATAAIALLEQHGPSLSEADAKQVLAAGGLDLPDERLVATAAELDAAMTSVGFPLVLKIQSPAIAHKSEVGGVRVGIADAAAGRRAYDEMIATVRASRPGAALQGVLVAPMAAKGVEVIVGTLDDATFGPMVMVGLGGVTTELYKDLSYRPAPVGPAEAAGMLAELRAFPLLDGFRGAPPADTKALCALIAKVSALAVALRGRVGEIELNPVLVHPVGAGVTVVDALMVRSNASTNSPTSQQNT